MNNNPKDFIDKHTKSCHYLCKYHYIQIIYIYILHKIKLIKLETFYRLKHNHLVINEFEVL